MKLFFLIALTFLFSSCKVYYYSNDKYEIRIYKHKYMLYNEPIENIYDIINEGKVIKQNNKIKFKDKRLNYQFFVTKSNKNDTLTVIYIKDGRNFTDTILEVGNKFVLMNKFKINDDYDMWR